MKHIIILMMLLVPATGFCQQPDVSYLQKSKNQKTGAWILLGGGLALAVGGAAVSAADWNSSGGDVMMVAGGAAMLGSIPLFIASSKNKKRAGSTAAFFKMEKGVGNTHKRSYVVHRFPAVTLELKF